MNVGYIFNYLCFPMKKVIYNHNHCPCCTDISRVLWCETNDPRALTGETKLSPSGLF